jgi:hypothetical protein
MLPQIPKDAMSSGRRPARVALPAAAWNARRRPNRQAMSDAGKPGIDCAILSPAWRTVAC